MDEEEEEEKLAAVVNVLVPMIVSVVTVLVSNDT